MRKTLFGALLAAAFVLSGTTARAHDDEDRVTQIDRYHDADVVHYDHHQRYLYTDEYGNVIGERTIHHDHHYVQPRYRHYRHHRRAASFFGGY
ncbi:MAG: hypothetical protein ABJB22_01960 [Verrucomicrobiota bacterium]